MKNRTMAAAAALIVASAFVGQARAGTFQSITIDGNTSDSGGGPFLYSDPQDSTTSLDYGNVYAANDANYLYLRFTLHSAGDPSSFLNNMFIDTDNNASTGFNVVGGGHVGSEMLIESGTGYQEKNGGFNEGAINGLDWLASPSGSGTDFEMRISRNATYASDSQPVFANATLSFALEAEDSSFVSQDFAPDSGGLTYTFAAVPEPSALALLGMGILGLVVITRSRRNCRSN